MKNFRYPVHIFFLLAVLQMTLSAQDTIFFEDFESTPGTRPSGWTTELEAGDRKWQFVNGGGTKDPGIAGSRRPNISASGVVNALYFYESLGGEQVILITPPIDLEFAIKPELHLQHAQVEGNLGFGLANDELEIYYKTSLGAPWQEANRIARYVDPVDTWTEHTILLPEGVKTDSCYFGFKATTNYGWGVCLDDILVLETELQQRTLEGVEAVQEDFDIFPTESKLNPVMRVDLSVEGNSGDLVLNSLEVLSKNSDDGDFPTNGVKLLVNHDNKNFYEADIVASTSFASGKAVFSSVGLSLPSGYTSLWIACDIAGSATHLDHVDVMLEAGKMVVGGQGFPATDLDPEGYGTIRESVFYDDFSTDKGWILTGDFERDRPMGLGGVQLGSSDPVSGVGDTMVLGNDLTGIGSVPGDYEPSISRYANLATSPSFNLFYYNDVQINVFRWLNVANNDTASVEMSYDGGSTWKEVWSNNNNLFADGSWNPFNIPMSRANRKEEVMIRFNLGPTTPTDNLSGWNIENLGITGNYVEYDVSPVALLSPATGCGHSAADIVTVRIQNFGPGSTPSDIPVRYSFDGGVTYTDEVIPGSIAFEGSVDYTFTAPIDLSVPGMYEVLVETLLDVDEEDSNNVLDTIIYVDPTYAIPYVQDFEEDRDFWRAMGEVSSLEYGWPVGGIIHDAASGTRAWVTNLDGDYLNGEESFLVGPCFDFSEVDYPVFECQLYLNLESGDDGLGLEYSLDNGQSWSLVGAMGEGDAYGWNWYNSEGITALPGNTGWTDPEMSWHKARILLDTTVFRHQPSVKFRFHFAADASGTREGIGIDDVRIYNAPRDVGVTSIDSPVSGCMLDIGDYVSLTMKNFGLDTLLTGETLVAGYRIGEEATVIDTFLLESDVPRGGAFSYTFDNRLNITSSGLKNIEAFTLLWDDTDFYNEGSTNDSLSKDFDVAQTPFLELPSEIYTVRPDTIVLDAYTGEASDTYLWQDGSTESTFQVTAVADGVYHVKASNLYCDYRDTTIVYRLLADVGVTEILDPVSDCNPGELVLPRVVIRNFGTDTLQAGDVVPLRYTLDGGSLVEEDALLASVLLPDSSFSYTFATSCDLSEVMVHELSAYTELPYDADGGNDALSENVQTYGYTPIDLGADTLVRALEYLIDAGAAYDSYLWQDGSTGQTLLVDSTGYYIVTVKQGSMCENSDTLGVELVIPDMALNGLSNPLSGCGYSSTEHLEIYIVNVGSDTLFAGDTLALTYILDAGTPVNDTLFAGRQVLPGDSILFSSAGTVDVSAVGTYSFVMDLDYSKDLRPGNNHLEEDLEVFEAPVVDLGGDQLVTEATYGLDAGAGFISYLWQDGTTEQQYLVDYHMQSDDQYYEVGVVDEHGCVASDRVMITFDLLDLGISRVVNPLSACALSADEEMKLMVVNYGTQDVSGEVFTISVTIDGGSILNKQEILNLSAGDSVEFNFGIVPDFGNVGSHSIESGLELDGDSDERNNSLDLNIYHYGYPEPLLEGGQDTVNVPLPYTLDAGGDYAVYIWNGEAGERRYHASDPGPYVLEVLNEGNCRGTDSVYLLPPVGVDDSKLTGELKLYPVPADHILHVEYPNESGELLHLDLFDANGRKVLVREYRDQLYIRDQLDLGKLSAGVYFLRLRSATSQLSRHVVVR